MKELPLSQGKFALVDDEDFEVYGKFKWFSQKKGNSYYAARNAPWVNGKAAKPKILYLHRLIMGSPNDMEVDHIDMDTLNNQKNNLRVCSHAENNWNKKSHKDNKLGVKGVCYTGGKFWARIMVRGKVKDLGRFKELDEARVAYEHASKELCGNFSRV